MSKLNSKRKMTMLLVAVLTTTTMFLTGCNLSSASVVKGMNISNIPQDTWMWNVSDMNTIKAVKQLKTFNINEVYVNTGWDPESKEFFLKEHPYVYATFIKEANNSGINVQALLSNSDWALEKHYKDFEDQVNVILKYNAKYKPSFEAVHLDIEPYLFSDWETNTENYLSSYIKNLEKIKKVINKHNEKNKDDLKLVLDIPFWYSQDKFNVKGKNVVDLLLAIADELVIMDYTTNQKDFVDRAVEVLEIADKYDGKSVKIAMEFQPEFTDITLYEMDPNNVIDYVKDSVDVFDDYKSFNGLSIHDYSSYKQYVEVKVADK